MEIMVFYATFVPLVLVTRVHQSDQGCYLMFGVGGMSGVKCNYGEFDFPPKLD